MRLLPRSKLVKTGPVDHADWNYRPLVGFIQHVRFAVALSLLRSVKPRRLIEIGYGSGVLMPELSGLCNELYGVDVHDKCAEVSSALRTFDVVADLRTSSAEALPFEDSFADCVLAVSVLEFIGDLERACSEIRRVLRPGGAFIVVTPGHSSILDACLKILTGQSAKRDFEDRRQAVLPILMKHFAVQKEIRIPPIGGHLLTLYRGLRLVSR